MPHGSNSSYPPDNYSREREHPSIPKGWLAASSHAHPCHDPQKVTTLLSYNRLLKGGKTNPVSSLIANSFTVACMGLRQMSVVMWSYFPF